MTKNSTVLLLAAAALTSLPSPSWAQATQPTDTTQAAREAELRAMEALKKSKDGQTADVTKGEVQRVQQALQDRIANNLAEQKIKSIQQTVQEQPSLASQSIGDIINRGSSKPQLVLNEQLNIEFPGGTLARFLDLVRESRPSKKLNVILPESASQIMIPPLTLSRVEVPSVLEALEYACVQNGRPTVSVSRLEDNGFEPVFAVRLLNNGRDPRKEEGLDTCVLSLNQITRPAWAPESRAGLEPEVVLTAVESAIATVHGPNDSPSLKFHRESGLLIIRGNGEQIAAARDVISNLEADIGRLASSVLGDAVTKPYPLMHVPVTDAADALRLAFPPDAQGNTSVVATAEPSTNALVVKAPKSLQASAAAILRLVDRAAAPSAETEREKLRMESLMQELASARERMEKQETAMVDARAAAAEYKAVHDRYAAQLREAETRAVQAREDAQRVQDSIREQAAQREQLVRTINEQREVIERLQAELAKQPK